MQFKNSGINTRA